MLSRRQFFGQFAATAIATIFTSQLTSAKTIPAVIKPQRLRPGAGVGLISPASATFKRENLDIVVDAVEALGLVPHFAPHLLERDRGSNNIATQLSSASPEPVSPEPVSPEPASPGPSSPGPSSLAHHR